jgi:hypothetical protein
MREERFLVSILMQPPSQQAFAGSFGFVVDSPCHYLTDVLAPDGKAALPGAARPADLQRVTARD